MFIGKMGISQVTKWREGSMKADRLREDQREREIDRDVLYTQTSLIEFKLVDTNIYSKCLT